MLKGEVEDSSSVEDKHKSHQDMQLRAGVQGWFSG